MHAVMRQRAIQLLEKRRRQPVALVIERTQIVEEVLLGAARVQAGRAAVQAVPSEQGVDVGKQAQKVLLDLDQLGIAGRAPGARRAAPPPRGGRGPPRAPRAPRGAGGPPPRPEGGGWAVQAPRPPGGGGRAGPAPPPRRAAPRGGEAAVRGPEGLGGN